MDKGAEERELPGAEPKGRGWSMAAAGTFQSSAAEKDYGSSALKGGEGGRSVRRVPSLQPA